MKGKSLREIMASCQPSFQFEDQSPQPNSSGHPLEVIVDEEIPGPSDAQVDSSPLPQSPGWKRRREWSAEEEEETGPGAEDVWAQDPVEETAGVFSST